MSKRPSLADNMKGLEEAPAPVPVRAVKVPAASREGQRRVLLMIDSALHIRLKIAAAKRETTVEAITRAAVRTEVERLEAEEKQAV